MQVTALIPVKGFRNAKQRLSPLLGAAERELLAEAMFRDALGGFERVSGGDHRDTLMVLSNLQILLAVQGRYGESEPLAREALVLRQPCHVGCGSGPLSRRKVVGTGEGANSPDTQRLTQY